MEMFPHRLTLLKMLMYVLIALVVVLLGVLVVAADRGTKAIRRARLRRDAMERLAAATAAAEAREEERRASQRASAELTSVMPTIHDRGPRNVV
jgi:Tfp pilus assembly protein PilX